MSKLLLLLYYRERRAKYRGHKVFLLCALPARTADAVQSGGCGQHSLCTLWLLIAVAIIFSVSPLWSQDAATWHYDAWTYRRTLTVTGNVRGACPDDVAVAVIPTLGKVNPDGSDLRVIDRAGKEVSIQILSTGFEDRVLLAFKAPYRGEYTLYFGNPKADAPRQEPFDVGLMLEVRELGEGEPKDWPSMQVLLEKSPKITGRWWLPSMAVGFNPLGPWDQGIYIFTGFVNCPLDGTYWFDTNSIDASFLLVDGKLVAQWPGWHGADNWTTHKNSIHLQAGTHRVEYLNAFRNHGACVAGWKKPQSIMQSSISWNDFAGYYITQVGRAENRAGLVADFDWDFEYDFGYDGRKATIVKFNPLMKGKTYHWDFGDGVSSTEESPRHVYLDADTYKVSLQVSQQNSGDTIFNSPSKDAKGELRVVSPEFVVQRVRVQPSRGHLGHNYEDRIAEFADKIKDYPVKELSAGACFEMGMICHEAKKMDAATRGFRAALEKGYKPQDRKDMNWLLELYQIYRDKDKYDDALWVCDYVLNNDDRRIDTVQCLNMKAEILFDYQNKIDAAEACCKEVLGKYRKAKTDFVRAAYIRTGEFAALRGKKEEAAKILSDAQNSDNWKHWEGDVELTQGSHMINFEEYMRQSDFETAAEEIKSLIWTRPTDILTGLPRHMRGRLFLAQKKYALAIQEFDRALTINPSAPFKDEVLYWKGESYEALGQKDKAKECFEKLVKEFPESKLSTLAEQKLKK